MASERPSLSARRLPIQVDEPDAQSPRQADQTGAMGAAAPTFTISLACSAAMRREGSGEAVDQGGCGEGLGQEGDCSSL
jgi:hypothetical protein